jgi:hypothetical protein
MTRCFADVVGIEVVDEEGVEVDRVEVAVTISDSMTTDSHMVEGANSTMIAIHHARHTRRHHQAIRRHNSIGRAVHSKGRHTHHHHRRHRLVVAVQQQQRALLRIRARAPT